MVSFVHIWNPFFFFIAASAVFSIVNRSSNTLQIKGLIAADYSYHYRRLKCTWLLDLTRNPIYKSNAGIFNS